MLDMTTENAVKDGINSCLIEIEFKYDKSFLK